MEEELRQLNAKVAALQVAVEHIHGVLESLQRADVMVAASAGLAHFHAQALAQPDATPTAPIEDSATEEMTLHERQVAMVMNMPFKTGPNSR